MINITITNYGCKAVVMLKASEDLESYSSGFMGKLEELLAMLDLYDECTITINKPPIVDPIYVEVNPCTTVSIRNEETFENTFKIKEVDIRIGSIWR